MGQSGRLPNLLRNGALVAIGIAVALLLLEGLLRLSGARFDASLFTADPLLGWSLRPNAEGWNASEGVAHVRINRDGRRDQHDAVAKPPGTLRIAFLGDSMVEARQVEVEETFSALLEPRLTSCVPSPKTSVEVYNFGVGGYGTAQELLMLRSRVWMYDPDIVILGIMIGNDLHDNHPRLNYNGAHRVPFFEYRGDQLVLDESYRQNSGLQPDAIRRGNVLRDWMNGSHVLMAFRGASVRLARLLRGADEAAPPDGLPENHVQALMYTTPEHPYAAEAWRITEGLMLQMANEVRTRGADFAMVLFPMTLQISPHEADRQEFRSEVGIPDVYYPDRRLEALSERENLPLLTLTGPLAEYATANQEYLTGFDNTPPGVGHFNVVGHRVIADALGEFLCQRFTSRETGPAPR